MDVIFFFKRIIIFNLIPMKTALQSLFYASLVSLLAVNCANNDDFSIPSLDCSDPVLEPNTPIEKIYHLANEFIQLYPGNEEDVLMGIVVSSDQGGNFYNKLYLVDAETQLPVVVNLEMAASFTEYPPGTKILLQLGGLYCTYSYGKLNLGGGIYTSSKGKKYIGSIAKNALAKHIQKYCNPVANFEPYNTLLTLEELKNNIEKYVSKLVTIQNVQFDRRLIGKKLYDPKEVDAQGYTLRKMVDQQGHSFYIRTGKLTKDFVDYSITENAGTVTGIADPFNTQIQFYPRTLADLRLDQSPFADTSVDPETTEDILVEPGKEMAFPGSDFENWTDFISSLNRSGLKFATQAPGEGWNTSTGLAFRGSPTKTDNAFTATNIQVPSDAVAISFLLKGMASARSLSINVYDATGASIAFNLENIEQSKIIFSTGSTNLYKGTIDTKGAWIKIILNLQGFDYNTSGQGDLLTFRFGGKTKTIASDYNLVVDEIRFEDNSSIE